MRRHNRNHRNQKVQKLQAKGVEVSHINLASLTSPDQEKIRQLLALVADWCGTYNDEEPEGEAEYSQAEFDAIMVGLNENAKATKASFDKFNPSIPGTGSNPGGPRSITQAEYDSMVLSVEASAKKTKDAFATLNPSLQ